MAPESRDHLSPVTFDLIDRYFAGEVTPAEAAVVRTRLPRYTELEKLLDDPVTYLKPFTNADALGNEPLWEVMRARIARTEPEVLVQSEQGSASADALRRTQWERVHREGQYGGSFHPKKMLHGRWWYTTCAVVIGFALLLVYNVDAFRDALSQFAITPHNGLITYATTNGQRATITLPDSSTITLGVASRVQISRNYAVGNRTVYLNGEALFNIMHRPGAPFTVIAGASTTRVLGTSFVVRHYTADSMTTVAVREGRVSVHAVVLGAAQQAVVSKNGAVHVHRADPAIFRFTSGVLSLDSVLFSKAIVELNRWYDADIRLGDPALAARRLTVDCAAGSVADLAELLGMTLNVRVVRDGRTLTLFPR